MWRVSRCCLFTTFLCFANSYDDENIHNRGWRPLTNQEVFHALAPNIQQTKNIELQNIDNSWSPAYTLSENIELLANDVIKLVKPQQIFGQFEIKRENPTHRANEPNVKLPELSRIENDLTEKADFDQEDFGELQDEKEANFESYKINRHKSLPEINIREPKKISELNFDLHNVIEQLVQTQKNINTQKETDGRQEISSNENVSQANTKSYEVTENSENTDLFHAEQTVVEENTGYVYRAPNRSHEQQTLSNITHNFLNILTKYNLNTKDKLENYALSRVHKARDSSKPDFIYVPIPTSTVRGYNNLNHLPVNPFLSVLLSNYGYYLPRFYGFQNGYRNLYGYLASNNIHNNKPFGLYKLYSDTDSWNK